MKKVLILSVDIDFRNSLSDKIKPYYEELSKIWIEQKLQFYRSSVYEFDTWNTFFKTVQKYNWESWVEENSFTPDMIWYKSNSVNYLTRVIEEKNNFINNTKFIELANNKLITSMIFSDESPKTHLLHIDNLKKFKSDEEVIIKPDGGSGWEWVEKLRVSEIDSQKIHNSNWYIIQELVDSSEGIDWIVDGIHDIRFFIYWDTIWENFLLRTPPKWDFRCNVSQWGESKSIPINSLPAELTTIVEKLQKKIRDNFWMIYGSADFTKSNWKFYLIEFNSSPWVNPYKIGTEELKTYQKKIVDFFSNYSK